MSIDCPKTDLYQQYDNYFKKLNRRTEWVPSLHTKRGRRKRALPYTARKGSFLFGGHSWDRTNDLPIKSRLLYQLSYMPNEYRVGGGITPAVLPHHRAYGSVHGGSR